MSKTPAHVIISLVFVILIGMVFGYSYFFYPNSHPIDCVIKAKTGKDCSSCGFSRAFSFYTHFQFTNGKQFNPYSWQVFLFMLVQFIGRCILLTIYFFKRKAPNNIFIISDSVITVLHFLFAFLPLII